ncbi:MAG: response regulator transcription factor [Elusimicrobia bacterium]|nr:response regulator transcription factor [Elusimicrobiota bacterium]
MGYRVLILEADREQQDWLQDWFKNEFSVSVCALAKDALEQLKSLKPDLLLFSLDTPDIPGMTFLSVLRDTDYGRTLPVVAIAAQKSEETTLRLFELGVEDCVAHPFDPRELMARCRTVLRRRFERSEHWGTPLSIGGIEIDPSQRRCVVAGKRLTLRPREFALLEVLMRKAGRVLTRPYLLESVWGMSSDADTRAVDVMVSRLRRSLGSEASSLIETISKLGYCFRPPGT